MNLFPEPSASSKERKNAPDKIKIYLSQNFFLKFRIQRNSVD
jgi:hypothetical protein